MLGVEETVDFVAGGIGPGTVLLMLLHADAKIVGHADVEVSRATGEDVDVEEVVFAVHG